ncbi:MAG: hypothetical protein Q8N02_00340 [Methylotenera sp.]|nr:hypothetical protein [Methylotenera sp.]MDP3094017.1 hypothetical protein [Methylotenera sp.]
MFAKNSRTRPLLFLILVTVLIVTTAVAFIAFDAEYRTDKFILSLVALLFAECLIFGYPIYLSSSSNIANSPRLPLGLGMYSMLVLYGAGAVLLALIAMTPISFAWLGILHLIMFATVVIFLSIWKIASGELHTISISEDESRRFIIDFRRRVTLLCELPNLPEEIKVALNKLREVAQYAVSESKPSSANIELKIIELLTQLNEKLTEVLSLGKSTDSDVIDDGVLQLVGQLTHSFKERELVLREQ